MNAFSAREGNLELLLFTVVALFDPTVFHQTKMHLVIIR